MHEADLNHAQPRARLACIGLFILISACTAHRPEFVKDGSPDVAHYEMKLHVDQSAGVVASDVRITLPAALVDSQLVFIIGGGQRISSAVAGDSEIKTEPTDVPWKGLQQIAIRPTRPGHALTIRIQSSGPPSPGGNPPINAVKPDLVELSLDGMWLPMLRGFNTPFTARAEISGLSPNMDLIASGRAAKKAELWVVDRAIADIDFALVGMPAVQKAVTSKFLLFAQDTTTPTARAFRQYGPSALNYLEKWFGTVATPSVNLVIVRRARASGYARKGYIVVTEGSRTGATAVARFISHELAHLWSGPVDPTTEHRWVQESVAEYVALRYIEHELGAAARDSIINVKRLPMPSPGPLLRGKSQGERQLYDQGPLLLIELEKAIGRSALDEVLVRLAQQPPTTTSDFLRVLSAVAGTEAATRFETKLRSAPD